MNEVICLVKAQPCNHSFSVGVRLVAVRRVIVKHKHARRQRNPLMTDYYPSPYLLHTHAHIEWKMNISESCTTCQTLTGGVEITCEYKESSDSPNVLGRWSVWRSPFSGVPFGVHDVYWGVVWLSSSGRIMASGMQTKEQRGRGIRRDDNELTIMLPN